MQHRFLQQTARATFHSTELKISEKLYELRSLEKTFIVVNGTTGAYTVQFKTASGSGVTFATTDKGTKFFFSDGTNINEIISSEFQQTIFLLEMQHLLLQRSSGAVLIDSQARQLQLMVTQVLQFNSTGSGDITLDSVADIILDADGGDIFLKMQVLLLVVQQIVQVI